MHIDVLPYTAVTYNHWDGNRQAKYRIFEPSETGFTERMCVFGEHITEAAYADDARIIKAIWQQEDFDLSTVTFYQLQSRLTSHSAPSGFYRYHRLTVEAAEAGYLPYSVHITGWQDAECPVYVYEAFKEEIGDFWTLEEYISRDNPIAEEAYRSQNYTDQQMAEELEWARKWLARCVHYSSLSAKQHRSIILTPEEAKRRGYRFDPNSHMNYLPTGEKLRERLSEGVFVDLRDSYLRGQYGQRYFKAPHELGQPLRFSFWTRMDS